MPTYGEVQQRVALDCLNRIDLLPETKRAIQAVIRKYEKRRFWFNETATSIACSIGQAYIVAPTDLLTIQEVRVTVGGNRVRVNDLALVDLKDQNDSSATGRPIWYSPYGENLLLAPIPDSAYAVEVSYLQKLPALSADSDTNSWLSAMEDAIVFGAASMVATHFGDAQTAVKYANLENTFYKMVCTHRDQRITRRLRPTRF